MKKFYFMMLLASISLLSLSAATVKVTMNNTARVMTLVNKATQQEVGVGTATSSVYTFDVEPGTYVLTGWNSDAKTQDYGTIELTVTDEATQEFKVFVVTATCGNANWTYGTDWTMTDLRCNTRDGQIIPVTLSQFTLSNKTKYLLALNGCTYNYRATCSSARADEGYMDSYGSGTVTANANSSFSFPVGGTFTLTYPTAADADIYLKPGGTNGAGSIHYVAFNKITPLSIAHDGDQTIKTYRLADGFTYSYRLWQEGRRTKAGIFQYNLPTAISGKVWKDGADGFTSLTLTADDLSKEARWMNTDPTTNSGANVANIMLTVNERGHLRMNNGETKMLGAQRDWQLTNSSTANYFIEPDYHYTVLNLDGTPGCDVVSITKPVGIGISPEQTNGEANSKAWESNSKDFSPWAQLTAHKPGSALVLVTYDAMEVKQWTRSGSGTEKSPYSMTEGDFLYGSEWSALWPENTGVFVVTVGDTESALDSKMVINEEYNTSALKNAGAYVDAEHDVFYYLNGTDGYTYTFKPEGVAKVELAYPHLSATEATYSGFGTEGVTAGEDGSYSLLLKEGRQIVRLTGTDGGVTYQVLTAKRCTQTITNKTHTDGNFYPGDEIEVQYSGLYHPANKMSGIYNMTAYVAYKGLPEGTELMLGKGQYQFGGTPSAQLVKTTIPANVNTEQHFVMDRGVLQVTGFGDPIGNHRYIDPVAGRSPNFTAISHQTYFGALPNVDITLATPDYKAIEFDLTPADGGSLIALVNGRGEKFNPDSEGLYHVIPDTYTYTIITEGYKYVAGQVTITGQETETTAIAATLEAVAANGWDGISIHEPQVVTTEESADATSPFYGMEGYYKIESGYNLAWVAQNVNTNKVAATNAVLCNDITLSDMPWTTIGNATATPYKGTFEGAGYTISGLSIEGSKSYQASLFGYTEGITLRNFTLEGAINSTASYTGAVVSRIATKGTLYGINSKVNITMEGTGSAYAGGLVGWLVGANGASYSIEHCSYSGTIDAAQRNYVGGLVGNNSGNYDNISIRDCKVSGSLKGANYVAGIIATFGGGNSAQAKIENCLATADITATGTSVGAIWAGNYAASGVTNSYVAKDYALTNNQGTTTTADQLANGQIAFALGQAWGQTIGQDAEPQLDGETVKYHALTDTYYNSLTPAYTLRTLTFEDADYRGNGTMQSSGEANWSSLIDNPQYGGPLLYGESGMGDTEECFYYWADQNNTQLAHDLPFNWGSYCYWGGGHAISHYATGQIADHGGYDDQLTIYKDGAQGITTSGAGHNGSNNFAVHYGYTDNSGYSGDVLPALYFSDGEARVIDHMWVNNTTYALNCYLEGNGLTSKITNDDWVKIVAIGYDAEGQPIDKTAEVYLCNGPKNIVKDWTRFDLSVLGPVSMIELNVTGSSDNGFGFSQPAYFAYDDVAVRFNTGAVAPAINVANGIATVQFEGTLLPGQLDEVVASITEPYSVLDLSGIANMPGVNNEQLQSYIADKPNTLIIVPSLTELSGRNIINDGVCAELVINDKTNFVIPQTFTATTATYTRTSTTGEWKSAVLPFDFVIPEDMRVLNNATIEDSSVILTEVPQGTILTANTPFIYSTTATDQTIVIEATDAVISQPQTMESGVLLGTYQTIPAGQATGYIILNPEGTGFATATSEASIPAFRAYIVAETESKTFHLVIDDPTSINDIAGTADGQPVDVFTADGRLVRQGVDAATALQGLSKGTYIIGGQKIRK